MPGFFHEIRAERLTLLKDELSFPLELVRRRLWAHGCCSTHSGTVEISISYGSPLSRSLSLMALSTEEVCEALSRVHTVSTSLKRRTNPLSILIRQRLWTCPKASLAGKRVIASEEPIQLLECQNVGKVLSRLISTLWIG